MFHVKRSPIDRLRSGLAALEREGLLRHDRPDPEGPRPGAGGPGGLSLRSNDYLGLAGSTGAGASRLVGGDLPEHHRVEEAVARWLGVESSLLFSSGFAANVGLVSALAQPGVLVVSDALNHASLVDGARLGRARVLVSPHLDLDAVRRALRERQEVDAWVVVESYYSMDADSPDLATLASICAEHGAGLLVDEAHAAGIFGPEGRGLAAAAGVCPEGRMVGLGKALGLQGGMVAGPAELRAWLWNHARSFVFSTGASPLLAREAYLRLSVVAAADGARERLRERASRLRAGLEQMGLSVRGHGPIVPVVIGPVDETLRIARALQERGVHVQAIRPPSVPRGTARIRMTVNVHLTDADIDHALTAWRAVV